MANYDDILSMGLESFRTYENNGVLTVLSTLENLELTDGIIPCDKEVHIYAENVTIKNSLKMLNASISVHQFLTEKDSAIILSGDNGKAAQGINLEKDKEGLKGGDGAAGGKLTVYAESGHPECLLPTIITNGGNGGYGQEGTAQTAGGDGGNGGSGGFVQILYRHPLTQMALELTALKKLNKTLQEHSLDELIIRYAKEWREPSYQTLNKNIEKYHKDKNAVRCLDGLLTSIGILIYTAESNFRLSVNGGSYGVHGTGAPGGKNGLLGNAGQKEIVRFELLADFSGNTQAAAPMHLAQCRMLLEKVKLMYFASASLSGDEQEIIFTLQKLTERLELFNGLKAENPLLALYTKENIEEFQNIYKEAAGLLNNIKNGLDYFGHDPRFVPLASFSFYREIVGQLVDNFKVIEDSFNKYYQDLKENKATMEALETVISQFENEIKSNKELIEKIKSELFAGAEQINFYQNQTGFLNEDLLAKINSLANIIEKYFKFSLKDVQMAISTLVSSPDSIKKWTETIIKMGCNHLENISDDYGKDINRKYIVTKIRNVSGTIMTLIDDFKQENDGKLAFDELSATKLLAAESEIFSLLNSFYEQFPAELTELKNCFREYASVVLNRNSQILLYNALSSRLLQTSAQLKSNNQKLNKVKQESFQKLNPNLPEVAAMFSQMYYAARRDVMEVMSLTARAYRFWSLSEENIIAKLYDKAPKELNHAFFTKHQFDFVKAYQKAVEDFGRNASLFPARKGGQGIMFKLTAAQIAVLKEKNVVFVTIDPSFSKTSKQESPFFGYYNIRLSTVRVWVEGAVTADDILHVNIMHTGTEGLVNKGDKLLTFRHEPRNASFEYDLKTNKIKRDGVLGLEIDKSTYELIGPFTTWRISIKEEYNSGLNLKEVAGISLEFHGSGYPY
ncbi:MAG: hypothetical protein FWC09_10455 [Lachnospiraceae bacterium]|nr:hypothetical protein [Lachnospiraceae bacterium]